MPSTRSSAGAYDYLTKPADPERLLMTIRRAAERGALAVEVKQLRAHIDQGHLVAAQPVDADTGDARAPARAIRFRRC